MMTDNDEAINSLRKHFFFALLDDAQWANVQATLLTTTLSSEQHLFHAGEKARHFFVLQTGQMQLYRLTPSGEEKVLEIIYPEQAFAESLMFLNAARYPLSSKAVLDSVVWCIDIAVFRDMLLKSNDLCLRLLGSMSRRLHSAIQDSEQLTVHHAFRHVTQLLLQSAPNPQVSSYQVTLDTPHQVPASSPPVSPETFSRVLQQLSSKNLIALQGDRVDVLDAFGLQHALDQVDLIS